MKIYGIDNRNFGMAVKATPEAKEYLLVRLSKRGLKKFEKLAKFAEKDFVDVNLSTETRYLTIGMSKASPYSQLIVKIGDSPCYEPEGMSFFIIRAVKKAVNRAHFLSESKKRLDNIL